MVGRSRRARPLGGVTIGNLGGEGFEVVVVHGLPEPGDDAEGERVAADAGEVFAEQVNCPPGIAGDRGADHFYVVAFPRHRPTAGILVPGAGDGAEIGGGKPEAWVGADREAQCGGGAARVDGSLRLLVPGGRSRSGGDPAAVDLYRRPGGGRVIMVAGLLVWRWLHACQAARAA
jgi:hypothetical protein